ncbi:MAG: PQQ-binding-like beta-propeller repeat protein [Bacteroidota bacterium]|nr:PQQ-binding-like beta-propeller repeat protein [Bacteroidota bacterium]
MKNGFYLICLLFWSCNIPATPEDIVNSNNKMKLLWEIQYEFIGSSINATPLILGDSLVIMSAGKEIIAVEQSTGRIRWKYFVSNETNIQVDKFGTDGIRIYATHVEDIRAINIFDGSLAWLLSMPKERGQFWTNSVLYNQNKLFVSGQLTLYCINPNDGTITWSKKLLNERGSIGSAVACNNSIIVGASYGFDDSNHVIAGVVSKLYSLNSNTSDSLWSITHKSDGGFDAIVCENGIIYGGSHFPYSSASFEAFDAGTGERKWSNYTPNEAWDYNDCVIAEDKIIANTGPYWVSAFNKNNGELLWRTFVRENADSWKVYYYGGYIYHPQGGRLYILDPNDGKILYSQVGPKNQVVSTMAVGNGKVFVCGYPTLQCYETYKP